MNSPQPSLAGLTRRHLPLVQFLADSFVWATVVPILIWLRVDDDWSHIELTVIGVVGVAVALQGATGWFFGPYRRRWRFGSFDEVRGIAQAALATGSLTTVAFWQTTSVPRSVPVLATGFTFLGQVALRSLWRLSHQRAIVATQQHAERLVVVGAGDGATQVLRTLRDTPQAPFRAVALVDDDPSKRNLSICGVPVVGAVSSVTAVAAEYGATAVLIAVPSALSPFIRTVTDEARGAGLQTYVLPSVEQLYGAMNTSDIRPVSDAELLGRVTTMIASDAVSDYVADRRVMVTGAGGSIGREICKQLQAFSPSALIMLDRDESGLHGTQLELTGAAMLDDPGLVLADIRDAARLDEVFALHRPDVVFHAAALKHLPLLEAHRDEGWKTNVLGTSNLLRAAGHHGVKRFVNVSTDKAAAPTNVLGITKRIAERLTAWADSTTHTTDFVSVRFGNVLGSNGSVLKTFEAQAASGGPITVTHPDVTRFFMTIAEASRLTIHAGGIGSAGEVMILDMGEPVRIAEVAERFAAQHQPPLEIVYSGLRPGEKIHETLLAPNEVGVRRAHPMITHVDVPPLMFDQLPDYPPELVEMAEIASAPPPRGH